jgi:hypothetical protein
MGTVRIRVWDLPLRVFHWLLALSFAGAFLASEGEGVRDLHVVLGYTVAVLVAFRLVWGVAGSRYARFRSFAFGPQAVRAYLASLLARRPLHYVGHNPAGGWAIYALLALGDGLCGPRRRGPAMARRAARERIRHHDGAGDRPRRGRARCELAAPRKPGRGDGDRIQIGTYEGRGSEPARRCASWS